jgi:hypothetical protein
LRRSPALLPAFWLNSYEEHGFLYAMLFGQYLVLNLSCNWTANQKLQAPGKTIMSS